MIIIQILSVVAIIKGIIQFLYHQHRLKRYYKVIGTVVNFEVERYTPGKTGGYIYYYPVIAFTDKHGEEKLLVSQDYNPDRPLCEVGSAIDLLVNPTDSNRFLIDVTIDRLILPLLWVLIGGLGFIFTFIFS
jgi:hypothetical protein